MACRGGLRFGALAGLFYAVQQVSSIARAEKGLQDIVTAGTATGAVFGATGNTLLDSFVRQAQAACFYSPCRTQYMWVQKGPVEVPTRFSDCSALS